MAIDNDPTSTWQSSGTKQQWWMIDFHKVKEISGLVIDWQENAFARQYDVQISDDGKEWENIYRVTQGKGGRDYIFLPDAEARFVRLSMKKSSNGKNYGIRNIDVKSVEFGSSPNAFFTAIASEVPRGYFPKYFSKQMSYWTIVGVSGIRSMFVYERGKDTSLIIGAGIPEEWLNEPDGIVVKELPTYYGDLNYSMKKVGESLVVEISGDIQIPPGKIILKSPLRKPIVSVQINGKPVKQTRRGIVIDTLPATVLLKPSR
jgi:hypothetical protein